MIILNNNLLLNKRIVVFGNHLKCKKNCSATRKSYRVVAPIAKVFVRVFLTVIVNSLLVLTGIG